MFKKTFLFFGILLLLTLSFKSFFHNFAIKEPNAADGVLDLATYNVNRELLSLNGEWEFYWKELLDPGFQKTELHFEYVPSNWKSIESIEPDGFGTYRLRVKLPLSNQTESYGLYLNRVGSAYKIFINGTLRDWNGSIGISKDLEIPHRQTKVIYFDLQPQEILEIVIQVSNFHHLSGGLKSGVLFSSSKVMQSSSMAFFLIDFFAVAVLIVMVLIYSSLYLFKPEKQFLYFILFLIFICIYVAGTGENILSTLFPGLPWIVFMKLIHICMALHFLFYNNLLNLLYPAEKISFLYQIIHKSSLIYALICLFTSVKTFVTILPLFHMIIFISVVYWLVLLAKAMANKKKYSIIIFSGLVIYAISVGLEVAYVNQISHNPRAVPIGILFFSLSYIIVSTKTFADSYSLVETAEEEKHLALAQASQQKAQLTEERQKISVLQETLTNSDSINQIDKIWAQLPHISYIISGTNGCCVYGDQGEHMFDLDLTLKKITEIFSINQQLIRCSKAYVVNPAKALKVVRNGRRYELIFLNRLVNNIPVGNKYLAEIRNTLQKN